MNSIIQLFYSETEIPAVYRLEVSYEFEEGSEEENLIPNGTGNIPTSPNESNIYELDLNLREGTEEELESAILGYNIELGTIEMEEDIHEIHIRFVSPNGVVGTGTIKAKAAQQETRPIIKKD